jgi:hypothetical protein
MKRGGAGQLGEEQWTKRSESACSPKDKTKLERKFQVLTAVRFTLFFWFVMPFRLIRRYRRFGETSRLHLETPCAM